MQGRFKRRLRFDEVRDKGCWGAYVGGCVCRRGIPTALAPAPKPRPTHTPPHHQRHRHDQVYTGQSFTTPLQRLPPRFLVRAVEAVVRRLAPATQVNEGMNEGMNDLSRRPRRLMKE